jgi:hypothetical protein
MADLELGGQVVVDGAGEAVHGSCSEVFRLGWRISCWAPQASAPAPIAVTSITRLRNKAWPSSQQCACY